MQIHGPSQVHGAQPISAPHKTAPSQQATQTDTVSSADQLDISHEADLVSRMRDIPDIRSDRVADIRAAIEAGEYETDEKLQIAVGRVLDEIG